MAIAVRRPAVHRTNRANGGKQEHRRTFDRSRILVYYPNAGNPTGYDNGGQLNLIDAPAYQLVPEIPSAIGQMMCTMYVMYLPNGFTTYGSQYVPISSVYWSWDTGQVNEPQSGWASVAAGQVNAAGPQSFPGYPTWSQVNLPGFDKVQQ